MVTKIFPAAYVDGIRDVSHVGTFAFRWCIPSWAWSEDGKPLSNLGRIHEVPTVRIRLPPAEVP
jgi:hypothetical protein